MAQQKRENPMAKESTAALVERHERLNTSHKLAEIERDEAPAARWLRCDQRAFSIQQRMWLVEDELMARAVEDEDALQYMGSFLGVEV